MRKQIVGAVAGLAVAGATLVAGAAQAEPAPKVVVCHVTASGKTIQLSVGAAAAREGHAGHAGDTIMDSGTCGELPPPPPEETSTTTTTIQL
jgi:hypothetical protein